MCSIKRPKVIFAANLYPEHNFMMQRYESIVKGFPHSEIYFVDIFNFFGDQSAALELEKYSFDGKRLREFFDQVDINNLNRAFLKHIQSFDWDILYLATISHFSQFLLPETLRELSQPGKLIVGIFGDDETQFKKHLFWAGLFDAVIAYTKTEVEKYKKINPNTYFLPIGTGKIVGNPMSEDRDIDLTFIGRPYGSRASRLKKLKEAGYKVRIYGSPRWKKEKVLRDQYLGFLNNSDFWNVIKRSKIILNFMENPKGQAHINAKVFEAAMAGALPITSYYQPFETTYGLKDGESIVFFHSNEDLIEKVEHYLSHTRDRVKIATNLQTQIKNNFMYEDLYADLIPRIEKQWRDQVSVSHNRRQGDAANFTVIQFVNNLQDQELSELNWSNYEGLEILYVSKEKLRHPGVLTGSQFLRQLDGTLSNRLRKIILLVGPQTNYDPVTLPLLEVHFEEKKIKNGAFCNSIVKNIRLRKSNSLIDIGSSAWHRDSFLRNAPKLIRYYQHFGPILPAIFVREELSLIPIPLNQINSGHMVYHLDRYRSIGSLGKKIRERTS